MGRFDALTQIEEKPEKKPAKKLNTEAIVNELEKSAFFHPKNQPPPLPEKADIDTNNQTTSGEKNHEIMNSRIHETQAHHEGFKDKPQKYSTLLYGHSIKNIKLYSAEKEIKDYEVIELALSAFFKKK
jgi:hypothetical protein